jgi:hypothetical protein
MGMQKLSQQIIGGGGAGGDHALDTHLDATDITDNDVSISAHGLTPKLSDVVTQFLNGEGAWTVPAGGSGGDPGGSTTEVQFNDAGGFGGAVHAVVDGDDFLKVLGGTSDNPHHLQRAIWQGSLWILNVNYTNASLGIGMATGQQGGQQTGKALSTTNILRSMPALVRWPGTAAGLSWVGSAQRAFWRGDAAGLGGFWFAARVGYDADNDTEALRRFAGVLQNPASVSQFNTAFVNCAGFSHEDTGESNWMFRHNDGSGSPTAVDTGLAHAGNKVYDMRIFCPPNGSTIYWWIQEVNGSSASGSVTTDLPTNTVLMYGLCWCRKDSASLRGNFHIIGAMAHSAT